MKTLDKVIHVYLCSKKDYPFNVWCFNGSEKTHFPDMQRALLNEELGINRFIKEFKYEKIDLSVSRAYYFSVFAAPC